jgi:copper ion binding protein
MTMEKTTLSIPNISCGHCVKTIEREIGEISGVSEVKGDAESKQMTISWEAPASLDKIKDTLEEIHYPAE